MAGRWGLIPVLIVKTKDSSMALACTPQNGCYRWFVPKGIPVTSYISEGFCKMSKWV